jgi:hypothetical protein
MARACRPPPIAAELGSLLAHFGELAPLAIELEMLRRGLEPRADVGLVARRHMSAGQRVMVVAKLYPEPDDKRGRGQNSLAAKHFPMVVAHERLREVRL